MQNQIAKIKEYVLRRDAMLALVAAIVTVAVGLFMGWYNNKIMPLNNDPVARYTAAPGNPLSFMSNWDGPDYLRIAAHGYTQDDSNFFPLYPLLIHVVSDVIGSPLISALLVAWIGLVGAIYFYLKLLRRLFQAEQGEALRGLLFFLLFPPAVFMLATYTEGLFMCFSLGAIYFALTKRWLAAAGLTLLAGATHISGVFVIALLVLVLWEEKVPALKIIAAGIIGSLGLAAYALFCQIHFHSAIAFITAQKSHGWLQSHGLFFDLSILNILFIALLVAAAWYWRRRRRSFAVYSLLFLLIPLVGRQFGGFNRYVLAAFPIPLMFYGYLRHRKTVYAFAIAGTAILWTYTLLQYAAGWTGN